MEGKISIVTPEDVKLSFETAGIGSWFIALLIDTVIQVVLFIIIISSFFAGGITFEKIQGTLFSWYTALLILISLCVFIGYFIFFELILKGRTPGKAAVKLRAIMTNGQPLTFAASVIRNIFRIADMLPGLYAVGVIVMFLSNDSRRVGDYAAGTIVVKEYVSKIPVTLDVLMNNKDTGYNPYPLTKEEYRLLKGLLTRMDGLIPDKRETLINQLSDRFYNKFNIPFEERKEREKFLENLMELNSR